MQRKLVINLVNQYWDGICFLRFLMLLDMHGVNPIGVKTFQIFTSKYMITRPWLGWVDSGLWNSLLDSNMVTTPREQ